jgi:hypothetical protein
MSSSNSQTDNIEIPSLLGWEIEGGSEIGATACSGSRWTLKAQGRTRFQAHTRLITPLIPTGKPRTFEWHLRVATQEAVQSGAIPGWVPEDGRDAMLALAEKALSIPYTILPSRL